jgi:hypothetical protein
LEQHLRLEAVDHISLPQTIVISGVGGREGASALGEDHNVLLQIKLNVREIVAVVL